ncbi:MAG TPA: hypothetical protein VGC47_02985 [Acidimicrobiia bacterium]|jgi:hypothetical protein
MTTPFSDTTGVVEVVVAAGSAVVAVAVVVSSPGTVVAGGDIDDGAPGAATGTFGAHANAAVAKAIATAPRRRDRRVSRPAACGIAVLLLD